MTLVAAWIRKIRDTEELVIASDSKLRFGCAWDCCQKVFPLNRGDSLLCFAGDALYAFPMINQLRNAINMNPKLNSRAADISDIRSYLLDIIQNMFDHVYDYASLELKEQDRKSFRFIFAGYSWKSGEYKLWGFQYQENIGRFSYRSVGLYPKEQSNGRIFNFIGDKTSLARERLNRLLASKPHLAYGELNLEPLEVLTSIIRDNTSVNIGGAPQIVKVYKHMNCMPYNVYWPNRQSGKITYFGRPLLEYERNQHFALDLDTGEIFSPNQAFTSDAGVSQEHLSLNR